jgi:CBS domain-containing protein
MRVSDVMTKNPTCCTPDTNLQEVARMMLQEDVGSIPVCEDANTKRVVGVITDRDIAIRAVAAGRNPNECTVREFMSHPVAVVQIDASLEEALKTMEQNQVRRVPIVQGNNELVGIVAQADVARTGQDNKTGDLVQEISQ